MVPYPEGFLCVDKPYGWTSFQVVNRLRWVTGVKRLGHAGTLDPFATGVLVVAVGRSCTRQIEVIQAWPKTYWFTMLLGIETDSLDSEGQVTARHVVTDQMLATFDRVVSTFVGTYEQEAPLFCAKKQAGVPMYEWARRGVVMAPKRSTVTIQSLQVVSQAMHGQTPCIRLAMTCSKGTYVRSVARDLARQCGTVAMVCQLIRRSVGPFDANRLRGLDTIQHHNWESALYRGALDDLV